jgi:hypothetical protein
MALLVGSSVVEAKPPDEKSIKEYGTALHELSNILKRVNDVPSAQAALPALNAQVDKILALQAALLTEAEGDPSGKPKNAAEEAKSGEMKQTAGWLRQGATRLGVELQRVLVDPKVAKVLQPVLSKLAEK